MQTGLYQRIGLAPIVSASRSANNKMTPMSERASVKLVVGFDRAYHRIDAGLRQMWNGLRVIRVPCCFSVQPVGWAVCLHCDATLNYADGVTPAAPGRVEQLCHLVRVEWERDIPHPMRFGPEEILDASHLSRLYLARAI